VHDFISAFLGGALLGLSAAGYLYVHGKIAGISGLVGQLFSVNQLLQRPAFWFLLGLFPAAPAGTASAASAGYLSVQLPQRRCLWLQA